MTMPTTFTRAIAVDVGEVPTSRHQRSIARAANDRLRFAVDMPWRVAWALYNGARLVRNPAENPGMVFPAEGEFFKVWQHLQRGVNDWPEAGPGEYEGSNIGSVLPQLIFGNGTLTNEPGRLNELFPMRVGAEPATTPDLAWQLGAMQRGAITAAGVYQTMPAFEAAQTLFQFSFSDTSFHGKSYGGWQPGPKEIGPCGPNGSEFEGWPNRIYIWTALNPDVSTAGLHGSASVNGDGHPVMTYVGSCPCGSGYTAAGHIQYIADMPFAWYVLVKTDAEGCVVYVDRLDKSQWSEGPYTEGPLPRHSDFPHILRTAWHYGQEFRGADSQRTPDTFSIEDIAFDSQAFWTRQYPLAPARGVPGVGNTVDGLYPEVVFTANPSPGEHALQDEVGNWAPHTGFVICGFHALATGLLEPVVVTVTAGSTVRSMTLTPDESGGASEMVWLEDGISPASLTASLGGTLSLASGGRLVVDAAELAAYKPQLWDQYLVTRFATANATTRDPQGPDYTQSESIVPALFTHGAILGDEPAMQVDHITENPLYQAWRRMSRIMRVMPRESLLSYTLSNGVATLRFKRELQWLNLGLDEADPWEGIAPPPYAIPSGEIVLEEGYIVRGATGTVTYDGHQYGIGQTFHGASETEYTATGDAGPWVEDGIRHAALAKGWSNEWVFFLQTHVFQDAETNIWKPSIYSDFFTFCANEHFMAPSMDTALKAFVNFGYSFQDPTDNVIPGTYTTSMNRPLVSAVMINPEAPSAYTYSRGANDTANDAFRKSRQVYPKPYEIAGCTLEFVGGNQIVVLRMVEKLRQHPNAPATIDPDPGEWSADDLARLDNTHATYPEHFRTDDNAVREYLRYTIGDTARCTRRTGDSNYAAEQWWIGPACHGACFPNFVLIKLVPECHEDGNATVEATDTRITADWMQHASLVLDCICEGFVAGITATELACVNPEKSGLYDYTREALYVEAFEGRSIPPIAATVRSDNPIGYGPLPSSIIYADTHNRMAACYNLLTRLRMDVPLLWEKRTRQWTGSSTLVCPNDHDWYQTDGGCYPDGESTYHVWLDEADPADCPAVTPMPAPYGDTGWEEWSVGTLIGAYSVGLGCCPGSPGSWCMVSWRQEVDWRVSVHPDWLLAIPVHIQDLIDGQGVGTVAIRKELRVHHHRVAEPPYTTCIGFSMGFQWVETKERDTTECVLIPSGKVAADIPSKGDVAKVQVAAEDQTDPSITCSVDSGHTVELDLMAFPGAYVDVPLADL